MASRKKIRRPSPEPESVPEPQAAWPGLHAVRLGLLLAALTAIVFGQVRQQEFVSWDDALHVTENPYLHPATPAHLLHFWRHVYQGLYIPVTYMAYAALAGLARLPAPVPQPGLHLVDLNAAVFHTASLVVHSLNALLVFVLLRRLVQQDWPALAGAALFALHPIQVEAVAWVSELRGLLAALFSLCALLSLSGEEHGAGVCWRDVLATLCFVLALLCKPSAAALPLLAWALDAVDGKRLWPSRARLLGGWLAVAAVLGWVTRTAQPTAEAGAVPLWTRPFVMGDALAFYLSKLLWPASLGMDYGRTPQWVLAHGWGYATWLLPIALGGLLLWQRRRFPVLAAAGAIFVAALLPVLGFVPFAFQAFSTVADRYLYVAMLGPALALAWALTRCRSAWGWGVCALALLLLTAQSMVQVEYWNNSESLFRHALEVNPRSWLAANNLGRVLYDQGEPDTGMALYQQSVRLNPRYAVARLNLGMVFAAQGQTDAAATQFQEAVRLDPAFAEAYASLGNVLDRQNKTSEAMAEYQIALRLKPEMAAVRAVLGADLVEQGRLSEAARELRQALKGLAPNSPVAADAHYNLGLALARQGRKAEAVTELEASLSIRPGYAPAQKALAALR